MVAERSARLVYRMLESWPQDPQPQVDSPFGAPWSSTVDLLQREADFLGAPLVVVELDVSARSIRRDDELRSDTRPFSEKVRITLETRRRGTLSWHTDRYRVPRGGAMGWRENVRAIALTMEALRAVDRYGAVHSSEQYRGFTAIEPSRDAASFASPEEALLWLRTESGQSDRARGRACYLAAARRMHPDAGGDPGDWARLDEARRLLEGTDLW